MTEGRAPASGPPLVSVVIAFLNGERFLREAVDSVFAQTYEQWELLLVDDGSGPAASTIAREYATREPARVRYLEHDRHENRGLSASRNVGISAARGAYMAFLDADDVWLPDKLSDQVAILEPRPDVGAMYGNALYWYGWTGDPADVARDFYPRLRVSDGTALDPPRLLERMLTGNALVPCPVSLLVRTAVLRGIGGFEERFTGMFEDQAFYAKLMLAERVLVVHRSWERYRQHPDSMCAVSDRAGATRDAHRRYLEWLAEYLDAQRCDDEGVRRALRRALRPFHRPRVDQVARQAESLVQWLRDQSPLRYRRTQRDRS
ncbi:MAG TPA: glycosyltransferase family A protein [Gemmatimonadaceae bacterium]|nr:glycosyltransferase family A protein [Gemmatimonadaceae bacterium]